MKVDKGESTSYEGVKVKRKNLGRTGKGNGGSRGVVRKSTWGKCLLLAPKSLSGEAVKKGNGRASRVKECGGRSQRYW